MAYTIKKNLLLLTLCFALPLSLMAQEKENEEFRKFRLGLSLGHGYIPEASPTNDESVLILPTVGFELQYWFNEKWGLASKNDLEIAKYTVEHTEADNEELVRENPIIFALPVLYSPWDNELCFMLGPGIELESEENFYILRLGVSYEFEIGSGFDFSPELVYDLKDGLINSFTLAIGVGYRF